MRTLVGSVVGSAMLLAGASALAQTACLPTVNTTVNLQADYPTGVIACPSGMNIPAGVTVTFLRNAANTPVTYQVTGNATIAGVIGLNGSAGANAVVGTVLASNGGASGPGGFDGGSGGTGILAPFFGGSGFGPGGGNGTLATGDGGGFGSRGDSSSSGQGGLTYGTPSLLPLIGGSGGGGGSAPDRPFGYTGGGGGGGGGALLVQATGTITLTGRIEAKGGASSVFASFGQPGAGGSGGAVRLVAPTITGNGGTITVAGGPRVTDGGWAGGFGRIRLEATNMDGAVFTFPDAPPSRGLPTTLSTPPGLHITAVAGVAAPASPTTSLSNPDIVLPASTTSPVRVDLQASNIPLGTPVTVVARGLNSGTWPSTLSGGLAGTFANSTAFATVAIPTDQPSVLSATVQYTLSASLGGGPVVVEGEPVERVVVTAAVGESTRVTYITSSGRELVMPAAR